MSIAKWKARYNVDMPTYYAAGNLTFKNPRFTTSCSMRSKI